MKFSLGLAAALFLPVLVSVQSGSPTNINVSAVFSIRHSYLLLMLLRSKLPLMVNWCTVLRILLRIMELL